MEKIIDEITLNCNRNSAEMIANREVRNNQSENMDAFLNFVRKEINLELMLDTLCKTKEYPTVMQKLIAFRAETTTTGKVENTKDLKDFFKVLRRVRKLHETGFYTGTIVRMLGCAVISPGSLKKNRFNNKFLAAFVSEEVRQKFWGTKDLSTLLIVERFIRDFNEGTDFEKFTIKNLRNSSLVIYFLGDSTLRDFLSFCKK